MVKMRLSKEERKEKILKAAFQVICQKGFKSVTTKAIADAAEINEALIFQHFSSKQQLLESVIEEIVNKQPMPVSEEDNKTEESFHQELSQFERFFLDLNLNHPENLKIIMYSVLEDYPLPTEFNVHQEGTFLNRFYQSIEKGKREWGFKPDLDPNVSISLFMGGLIYFVLLRILTKELIQNQNSFTDLFFKMLK